MTFTSIREINAIFYFKNKGDDKFADYLEEHSDLLEKLVSFWERHLENCIITPEADWQMLELAREDLEDYEIILWLNAHPDEKQEFLNWWRTHFYDETTSYESFELVFDKILREARTK